MKIPNIFKTKSKDEFTIKQTKIGVKKVVSDIKKWTIRVAIILVILSIGSAYVLEQYANWRAEHEWQIPAVWVGFVRAIQKPESQMIANAQTEAVKVEPKTDMEIIEQYHLSPVIKTIYFLESTSGKQDGCKDEGKFNGYGYRQNTREHKCYDSFDEVTENVNEWLENRLADNGNNLIDAVCYYNKGIEGLETCDYSHNFMLVLTKNF